MSSVESIRTSVRESGYCWKSCLEMSRRSLALLACGFASWVQAETLTLDQALKMAEEGHPRLQAGVAQWKAAGAATRTARAFPNPEAGALAGTQTTRIPGNAAGSVYSFSLTQPLDFGPTRSSRIEIADRNLEGSYAALDLVRNEVLSDVRRAFFESLRRQSEMELLLESLRLVEDLRQRIQVRVGVGEAGRLELVRADAEVATARASANAARLDWTSAIARLRAATGVVHEEEIQVQGTFESAGPLEPLPEIRQRVLEKHPSLRQARAEVARARAKIRHERSLRIPTPSLRAEIDRPPDTPTYRFGLSLPLPLWDRRSGPIAEATAQLSQAEALLRNQEMQLHSALVGAYGRFQSAGEQLTAFEQGIVREAEEALKASELAFQLGERGILEVLDAQRVLRTVRLQFLIARYDRQLALVDINELKATALVADAATAVSADSKK